MRQSNRVVCQQELPPCEQNNFSTQMSPSRLLYEQGTLQPADVVTNGWRMLQFSYRMHYRHRRETAEELISGGCLCNDVLAICNADADFDL